jgi:hypothetical protein
MMGLMYTQIDQWIHMFRHQKAEHTMHKYLAQMQVDGYLTPASQSSLQSEFATFGCPVASITATTTRVLRPNIVTLSISSNPSLSPLQSLLFFGGAGVDTTIRVGGSMRSERVMP